MNELVLTKTRIFEGVWEGLLSGTEATSEKPRIEVTHLQSPLSGVEVIEKPGEKNLWILRVPIPANTIADGVQTFVIRDLKSNTVLDSFTLLCGDALGYDIRAETALLREELDLLKRAFRRHCLDTM